MIPSNQTIITFIRLASLLSILVPILFMPVAQAQNPPKDSPEARINILESKIMTLETRISLLQEQLEAVIGPQPGQSVVNLPVEASPVRGEEDAPVTLVIFGDYQSDYTVRANSVLQRIMETYPAKVRLVYKQYPLSQKHPFSTESALAAMAALRQGRFWEFHELLMLNARRLDEPTLLVLAEKAGLELRQFENDRRSLWALEALGKDEKLAVSAGVVGVPTLFLNGRQMATWRYDFLKQQIEKLLSD